MAQQHDAATQAKTVGKADPGGNGFSLGMLRCNISSFEIFQFACPYHIRTECTVTVG